MKNMHRMLLVFHAEGKIPWSLQTARNKHLPREAPSRAYAN